MYVYGPVPSRRLGSSLGVSVIPRKACSYSCIYCQLGRTPKKSITPRSYFPKESVMSEIESRLRYSTPDYITFVGDGEPTLSSDLSWFIKECKSRWAMPVAVFTNSSLLFGPEVRENLVEADVVMPSLDAADENTFRRINRPHKDLKFAEIVEGLIAFRKSFHGIIRLEVMLVENVNDSIENLQSLKSLIKTINPDIVDVSIPTRPPAEQWVNPPSTDRLIFAQKLLGSSGVMTSRENGAFGLAIFGSVLEAIEQLCSRHPLRLEQAKEIAQSFSNSGELDRLIKCGKLRKAKYRGEVFILPQENDKEFP